MDNQHTLIKGYRDLSKEEIDAMNHIKQLATEVGSALDVLTNLPIDQRWLSIGRTDLQKGFMSVIRSIAQPTTF